MFRSCHRTARIHFDPSENLGADMIGCAESVAQQGFPTALETDWHQRRTDGTREGVCDSASFVYGVTHGTVKYSESIRVACMLRVKKATYIERTKESLAQYGSSGTCIVLTSPAIESSFVATADLPDLLIHPFPQISDQVADKGGSNPCSLYFLNVLVDTTIGTLPSIIPLSYHSSLSGVLVLYLALKGLTKACILVWGSEGFISGVYGHPPRIRL